MVKQSLKYLFIVNNGSGRQSAEIWIKLINDHFTATEDTFEIYELPDQFNSQQIKDRIFAAATQHVIATGGDGTVTMLANILAGTEISLGILPAGSANGMAKELDIPTDAEAAMKIIEEGNVRPIDMIRINNDEYFLHMSDLGLNAQLIKYFDEGHLRGKLGYATVIIKTLWNRKKLNVHIRADEIQIQRNAYMVAIANARMYGTGAIINPDGKPDDGKFEIIIIRRLSFAELLKMLFHPKNFDPQKTEILRCSSADINTLKPVYFQADGEYKGKTKKINAVAIQGAIKMIVPKN